MRSFAHRAVLPVLALLFVALTVTPVLSAQVCEGCGLAHDDPPHGGPITLTDWKSNETHTYLSLDCALRAMRDTYEWSRARWITPTGQEIALTRAGSRWDAEPAAAVALQVSTSDRCGALIAFADDGALQQWIRTHGDLAHSEPIALTTIAVGRTIAATADGFTDVPPDHWAAEAVTASAEAGLLTGDPDGAFEGDRKVSRYEMAVILQRLLQYFRAGDAARPPQVATAIRAQLQQTGAPEEEVAEIVHLAADPATPTPPTVATSTTEWPDVPADHWAADAVRTATAAGFMNGYPDGKFRGEEKLSRYEIAVILRRLITTLGLPPEPTVASAPQVAPTAGGPLDRDAPGDQPEPAQTPSDPRDALLRRLQAAGFTREQAERALAALQAEVRDPTPTAHPVGQGPAAPSQSAATRLDHSAQDAPRVRTTTPGLLGSSGLLISPTADTLGAGQATITASRFGPGDQRALGVSAGLNTGTEVTATATSGDLPDAIVVSARQPVYRSPDGRLRAAVGVTDVTDEIDTTAYAVVSYDPGGALGDGTVSAGIGGGDLLDGLFISGSVPIDRRTTAMVELLDIGDGDTLNAGLSYLAGDDLNLKAGIVDGHFAGALSYRREF